MTQSDKYIHITIGNRFFSGCFERIVREEMEVWPSPGRGKFDCGHKEFRRTMAFVRDGRPVERNGMRSPVPCVAVCAVAPLGILIPLKGSAGLKSNCC